jgi:competence ComEA-like helix-hairpin-helix protein
LPSWDLTSQPRSPKRLGHRVAASAIGVGQYQHDLSEQKLSRSLQAVVEDCVNAVGVDVNTASTPLLSRVSGIGEGLARSIISYREAQGPFRTRAVLKKVPRLGPKAFELSAGFLRIRNGNDPLGLGCAPGSLPRGATHSRGNQEPIGETDRRYISATPATAGGIH